VSVTYQESVTGSITIGVHATNGTCNSEVVTKEIEVNPLPGQADQPSGDNIICENVTSSTYTTAQVNDATGYQWELTPREAGSVTNKGTSSTVAWSNNYTGSSQLTARGINACGVGNWSDNITINKNLLPDPGDDLIGGPTKLCQGSDGVFTINEIYLAETHFWEIYPMNSGTISQDGGNRAVFTPSENYYGTVYLKVRGVNSCGNGTWSDDYTIIVNRKPILTVLQDHFDLCNNNEETEFLNINPKGGKYYYNNNEITGFNPQDYVPGNYEIDYIYFNTDNCSSSETFTVRLHDPPANTTLSEVDIYNNKYFAFGLAGESVQISTSSKAAYWHDVNFSHIITSNVLNTSILPDNTQEIKYYFRIKDQYCFSAYDSVSTISVITPPTPDILGKETVCQNSETVYRAQFDPPANEYYNYVPVWEVDGRETRGVDSIVLLADNNKSIRCYLVDSVNTQNGILIKSGNDNYKSLQQYTVSKPDLTGIKNYYCYQDTVNIAATSLHTIRWENSQQVVLQGNTLSISGITQGTTYKVYAIDQEDCRSESEEIFLDVKRVVAGFSTSDDQIHVGEKISFVNSTTGALTYRWDFGDKSHEVYDKDAEHYYYTPDKYEVKLQAYYDNTCVDSTKKEVFVLPVSGIFDQHDIDMKIYPNPTKDIVNVEFDKGITGILNICTINGRPIIQKQVDSRRVVVDLGGIKPGVYFMSITIDAKTVVYKIIKAE
jgi:hypothetical protein